MDKNLNLLPSVVADLRSVKWKDLPGLSASIGVPESTIKKIRSSEVKDPRISTVEALHNYFASHPTPPRGQPCVKSDLAPWCSIRTVLFSSSTTSNQ